jgi:hypothetical protein
VIIEGIGALETLLSDMRSTYQAARKVRDAAGAIHTVAQAQARYDALSPLEDRITALIAAVEELSERNYEYNVPYWLRGVAAADLPAARALWAQIQKGTGHLVELGAQLNERLVWLDDRFLDPENAVLY